METDRILIMKDVIEIREVSYQSKLVRMFHLIRVQWTTDP